MVGMVGKVGTDLRLCYDGEFSDEFEQFLMGIAYLIMFLFMLIFGLILLCWKPLTVVLSLICCCSYFAV